MCQFHTQDFSCGCVIVTGVDRCTSPACRPTMVYANGCLYECPNKSGGCQRLALSGSKKNQTGRSEVLATAAYTHTSHEVEKKGGPSKGTDISRPVLPMSKDECKEAVQGTKDDTGGKASAGSSSTSAIAAQKAPKVNTLPKPLPDSVREGGTRKVGKGSGKWGGVIDEELSLLDVEAED